MFSFHRPRIYRSVTGCCICRAKSSSSRFTDSKRYEEDFYDCFKLSEKRGGEICNACVLLVKRWKKLPCGTERNWEHVVDFRQGHGSRPVARVRNVRKPNPGRRGPGSGGSGIQIPVTDNADKKEFFSPKVIRAGRDESPSGFSDDVPYCISNGSGGSYDSSLAASPVPSPEIPGMDQENGVPGRTPLNFTPDKRRLLGRGRFKRAPKKNFSINCSFLDLDFWKREKTCCGIIFKGPCGAVILDPRFLNPCFCRSGTTTPDSTSPQSDSSSETSCFPSCENSGLLEDSVCRAGGIGSDKILVAANRCIPTGPCSD